MSPVETRGQRGTLAFELKSSPPAPRRPKWLAKARCSGSGAATGVCNSGVKLSERRSSASRWVSSISRKRPFSVPARAQFWLFAYRLLFVAPFVCQARDEDPVMRELAWKVHGHVPFRQKSCFRIHLLILLQVRLYSRSESCWLHIPMQGPLEEVQALAE